MTNRFYHLGILLAWFAGVWAGEAQGTAFTYQGRLLVAGAPANGSYDLVFTLATAATNGTVAGVVTNNATPVSQGFFTATLDFGAVFNGTAYWLAIAARTNGGTAFTPLNPLQPLTPVPGAMYAANAGNATTAVTATTLAGLTQAQVGAIATNLQAGLNGAVPDEDALLLHTNNTFTYHGVTYAFPMTTTACLQEIDALFPKASNGVPSGINIRLDDNAEYQLTSFVTLTNNYKITGAGPWSSGFCYYGPTNVSTLGSVMAALQPDDNQVYPGLPGCAVLNFFPSDYATWNGEYGLYQSGNLILEDFYVKTAVSFPCILMAVQAYDFYATRLGWYGSDIITSAEGNFAQTYPPDPSYVANPPAAIGLFSSVINQETIDDCTANELADGLMAVGNTWFNCRDLQAEDMGLNPEYPTTNLLSVGFGLYLSGNVYKAVVDSYAPYETAADIWVDGVNYTPPVINNVIGGQAGQAGICLSQSNAYSTILNYSFGSMPISEVKRVAGNYEVVPATATAPILTYDGPTTATANVVTPAVVASAVRSATPSARTALQGARRPFANRGKPRVAAAFRNRLAATPSGTELFLTNATCPLVISNGNSAMWNSNGVATWLRTSTVGSTNHTDHLLFWH